MRLRSKGGIALAVTAALFILWFSRGWSEAQEAPPKSAPATHIHQSTTAAERGGHRPDVVQSDLQHFLDKATPSQQGTAIDGQIRLSADGRVQPDQGLRQMFEYFLADADLLGLEAVKANMATALAQQGLLATQVAEALAVFDRYLDYRHALAEQPPSSTALLTGRWDELRAAFEARFALRRQILGGEVAESFFAQEEAEDRFVLESQALQHDQTLTEHERQQRLLDLERQLPDAIRAAREQTQLALILRERTQELREAHASEAEIHSMREQLLDPAAADRLADLDRQRQQWQQRVARYQEERDRIRSAAGLSAADQQAAIEQLLHREFEGHEIRRIQALERITTSVDG